MIAEINLFGVFVDARLATATVAGVALLPLRRGLSALGAYRWIWHPALVDLALFVLLWAATAAAAGVLQSRLVPFLG